MRKYQPKGFLGQLQFRRGGFTKILPMDAFTEKQDTLLVRQHQPQDAVELHTMLNTAFPPRSAEAWRWRFAGGPAGPATIHVLEEQGRLIGQLIFTPMYGFFDGHRRRFALAGGATVLPEARGKRGGMQRLVIAGNRTAAQDCDLVLAFPKERFLPFLQRVGGGSVLGRLPQWVHWRDIGALEASAGHRLGRGVRPAAAAMLGLIPILARASRLHRGVRLVELLEIDESVRLGLDRLAGRSAAFAPCIGVRDAAYLQWRWLEQPDSNLKLHLAYGPDGEVCGFCVFGTLTSAGGEQVGRIVDLLAGDFRSLRALVGEAVRLLRSAGCRTITCHYQDPRRWSRLAMALEGFFSRGSGPAVLLTPLCNPPPAVGKSLESWYLTFGDTGMV